MSFWKTIAYVAGVTALWEAGWWMRRRHLRGEAYATAKARAGVLNRPLVVIGAPEGGVTGGYGCGDVTVDVVTTTCRPSVRADITKPLPFEDNSVVVVVMCVLEYVADFNAAMRELLRVSGGELFIVRVEPWTLTSYLYPGTRRRLPAWTTNWPIGAGLSQGSPTFMLTR